MRRPRPRLIRLTRSLALLAFLAGPAAARPSMLAFYAPWDSRGAASLRAHADRIDWLAPAWISVTGADDQFTAVDAATARAVTAPLKRAPKLMPVVQNARGGAWDGANAAALLASPARRRALIDRIDAALESYGASGVMFDFEDLPIAARADYLTLLREVRARPGGRSRTLAVTVSASDPAPGAYARAADQVVLMAYDEHWSTGAPGPIASASWFAQAVDRAASQMPAGQLVVGLASYAYDWPRGGVATPLSVGDAEALAAANGATLERDAASGESHFAYVAAGTAHDVWLVDAESSRRQDQTLHRRGLRNRALWRLGTEAPALWDGLGQAQR